MGLQRLRFRSKRAIARLFYPVLSKTVRPEAIPEVEAICRMAVRSKPRSRNSSDAAFRMRVLVSSELLFCRGLCLSTDVARSLPEPREDEEIKEMHGP
jgi:hypothetical protein